MPNGTSEKPEQPYPSEPFIMPKVIGDCADCKGYVEKWIKHTAKTSKTGERNKDYDPSAASDAAVLWKRHVAEAHSEVTL
ncbi:hypothetical protein DF268_43600 [Streptomyces sp. V2]|nr:hypothetical protein DF268_43600 [Streptomyces sp. V2]